MSDHAWLVRAVESMRYDWSHATLAVTALPLPTTHRSLHGLRCRPHTLITRARPSDVTVDRALYCEPATVRRPLGRAQAGGRQAETQTPIMTSTLWGFSCSLQRRSRGPNGAKILLLFMAPRQCKGKPAGYWGIRQCAANTSGREKQESRVAKLG